MSDKAFVLQRIRIFAGKDIDPNSDKEVENMLRTKFNIHLPQRSSMEQSLSATTSDHEILSLITQYRNMSRNIN
jgi:DNA polymerase I-like protein with 3'-5' exonuclease and polymerase domains